MARLRGELEHGRQPAAAAAARAAAAAAVGTSGVSLRHEALAKLKKCTSESGTLVLHASCGASGQLSPAYTRKPLVLPASSRSAVIVWPLRASGASPVVLALTSAHWPRSEPSYAFHVSVCSVFTRYTAPVPYSPPNT